MTEVRFLKNKVGINGFEIKGHSTDDCDDFDGKLVCAAVSSAAIMAANTVTEIIGDGACTDVKDGYLRLSVKNPSEDTVKVLEGLKLHLSSLALENKNRIRIITEV